MGCPRENGTFGEFGCLGCGRRNRFRFYRVRKAVPAGKVISIEKNPEALKILYQNRVHFGISNMDIIEGTAPEVFEGLERPTHVFIGGAGRALSAILEKICRYGAGIPDTDHLCDFGNNDGGLQAGGFCEGPAAQGDCDCSH